MIRGSGGCFEVELDGELIYSKRQTGQFPDDGDILRTVQERDPSARPGH
ncbi:MAG: Rdx family protein [Myxococcota bacterium]|nr:Rdx family protein [Myxococcota bacterium]